MPLILPGNVGSATAATGYEVDNSLRFDDGSSDSLIRTLADPGGAGNRNKWTFSTWVKRGTLGVKQMILSSYQSDNYLEYIRFNVNDTLEFKSVYNGSTNGRRTTDRVFRDPSAWYHLVFIWDKDNSTTSEKMRIYVNGTEETSFSTSSAPSQATTLNADGQDISIGQLEGVGDYFDGYMCEVVFNDGQAYAADNYGEFDSDSPNVWKPKDVSGLTFGTNGFHLDFENSSSLGNDVSGNNNDFTVNNLTSVDQSTDTCTNNFATWNPINRNTSMGSFHHGNLEYEVDATFFRTAFATFGASQGKWYFECKRVIGTSFSIGIISLDYKARTPDISYIGGAGDATNNIGYLKDGNISIGGSETSGYASYGNGDTVMVAMDIDNGKVYFGVNGTWGNSGDPTSGSSGTGAVSFTPSSETWTFAVSVYDSHWEANFGSPMYSISSGNSDGNGYGNFEYSVPSGYYALNTKNLAEYG